MELKSSKFALISFVISLLVLIQAIIAFVDIPETHPLVHVLFPIVLLIYVLEYPLGYLPQYLGFPIVLPTLAIIFTLISFRKIENKKIFAVIGMVFILISISLYLILRFRLEFDIEPGQQSNNITPQQQMSPGNTPAQTPSENVRWTVYQDKELGVEFKYPSAWSAKKINENSLKISHPTESLITTDYNVVRWYRSYQGVEKITGFRYNSQFKKWGYLFYQDYYDPSAGPGDFRELEKIFTTETGIPVYCLSNEGGANHLVPISDNLFILMESIRCIRHSSYPAPEDKLYQILQSFRAIF